jgi:hypothetical protein
MLRQIQLSQVLLPMQKKCYAVLSTIITSIDIQWALTLVIDIDDSGTYLHSIERIMNVNANHARIHTMYSFRI